MAGIGVIVNPHSRRNRGRNGIVARFARIVDDVGTVAYCGDHESLKRAAEDFRRQEVDVLAVGGGDGTNSVVLTAFREVYGDDELPALAMLRGGTMNTVANGFGAPKGSSEALLARLRDDVHAGRRLVTREGASMDVAGRLCFLFGVGVVETWLREYYGRGRPHVSPMTAVETLAVTVGSTLIRGKTSRRVTKRPVVGLTIDGEEHPPRDYLTVAAGTTDDIGLGFRAFFRASDETERFHLLAITASAGELVKDLPRVKQGLPMRPGKCIERLVRSVTITPTQSSHIGFMADGDIDDHDGPLHVTVGPAVRVVVGAKP